MTPEERAAECVKSHYGDCYYEGWAEEGDIADAIRAAVAEEREACARMASAHDGLCKVGGFCWENELADTCAGHIARAIRARGATNG